jgi:putative hydrolase of the HAD superfamily
MNSPSTWKSIRTHRRQARRDIFSKAFLLNGLTMQHLPHKIADTYHDAIESNATTINKVIPTLEVLRENSIILGIITNGKSDTQRRKISVNNLGHYFHHIFIGDEIGCNKPDTEFYNYISSQTNLIPDDIWIVGDNYEWEVLAPQMLGYKTAWVDYWNEGIDPVYQKHPTIILNNIAELLDHFILN